MSKMFAVIGLGFGDEGKGTIVDALCKRHKINTVIRFNGGAQAAHNVVTSDGRHHTFSQFGSGTFQGSRTHLSKFHLLDPVELKKEAEALESKCINDPLSLVSVSTDTPVVTFYNILVNRLTEMSRSLITKDAHGSCGKGIGEFMKMAIDNPRFVITAEDLYGDGVKLRDILNDQYHFYLPLINSLKEKILIHGHDSQKEYVVKITEHIGEIDNIAHNMSHIARHGVKLLTPIEEKSELYSGQQSVVFEGAQGVLLDEWYGFHPHTTWSTTTFENVKHLTGSYFSKVVKVGVTRSYSTRHGNGPFPTYSKELSDAFPDLENVWNAWQTDWRVGYLDLPLLKYATEITQPDVIAVTHMDKIDAIGKICHSYKTGKKKFQGLPYSSKLKKANKTNLNESEKLTNWINTEISGVILAHVSSQSNLISMIESAVKIPVGILSMGRKAEQKMFTQSWVYDTI